MYLLGDPNASWKKPIKEFTHKKHAKNNAFIGLLIICLCLLLLKDCTRETEYVEVEVVRDSLILVENTKIEYIDRVEYIDRPQIIYVEKDKYIDRTEYVYRKVTDTVFVDKIVEKPTTAYIHTYSTDTVETYPNRLFIYLGTSLFGTSDLDTWERSHSIKTLGVDYNFKKNWIIGVNANHVRQSDIWYGGVKVGYNVLGNN